MQKRFLCGVPTEKCCGRNNNFSHGMKCTKSHTLPQEAFACYAAYLLSLGYTKVGSREFAAPDDGPIMVLSKKSRFGAVLRGGKEGRYMGKDLMGGAVISN
jgi:hypothetical protein